MGDLRTFLNKPEFLFRPSQLVKRLTVRRKLPHTRMVIELPWGHDFEALPTEVLGKALWHFGLYDLVVSEALWRLCEPGETVADIGANVGYTASLMAKKIGPSGTLYAFEPHPQNFEYLRKNIVLWEACEHLPKIVAEKVALSDKVGESRLIVPEEFSSNSGVSYISDSSEGTDSLMVKVKTLANVFGDNTPSVIKIDTEGHEERVLRGGQALLENQRIRDIIFEDQQLYPSPTMSLLENCGYRLFRLKKNLWGPQLTDPAKDDALPAFEASSLIATSDPKRLKRLFKTRLWSILRMSG